MSDDSQHFNSSKRYYARTSVWDLLKLEPSILYSQLFESSQFEITTAQRQAWISQLDILKDSLAQIDRRAELLFEYSVPRAGKRIDVLLLTGGIIFVIEFKVGASKFLRQDLDQAWDYALVLKNFHSESHYKTIIPLLVATDAARPKVNYSLKAGRDGVYQPLSVNSEMLGEVIETAISKLRGPEIDVDQWLSGGYTPTPTIIEAAVTLYRGHSVVDISRSDATALNLSQTAHAVSTVIEQSCSRGQKAICFVTGVPGAGKTLVGLNAATQHVDDDDRLYSVFLSGNGPLVSILQEALARDKVSRTKAQTRETSLSDARREVKSFIQNVHHFRDDGLMNPNKPPHEHVVLFDEAQRAWDSENTSKFMKSKKGQHAFFMSEPEFLISCMDRHVDWAVIVCLVGGAQEINTGEAGISEWVDAILRSFSHWHVYVSPNLRDSEFGAGHALERLKQHSNTSFEPSLHLSVSMRSFRAENVARVVKSILDLDSSTAEQEIEKLKDRYPIVLCRDVQRAKEWLREQSRGTERYGMIASSKAQRLRPYAIDVKSKVNPVHWFLGPVDDVRSSCFLEEAATEFDVQGLELDWTAVIWDADFRHDGRLWENWQFKGSRWQKINRLENRLYQKNAYRVLLTRARQGMVIVVPEGDDSDETRKHHYYDRTYDYLRSLGLRLI